MWRRPIGVLDCKPMKKAVALAVIFSLTSLHGMAQDRVSLRALGQAFAGVYDKVAPSVVVLEVASTDREEEALSFLFRGPAPRRAPRVQASEGSGMIITRDGYILTNAHVIQGAETEGGVTARMKDGSRWALRIVGVDEKTDLAVLKAEAKDWPAVAWGDSDRIRVGEFVCSIGAPYELDYTLTVGVLSAKGRSNLSDTLYEDYLQTDAAINPGNSGGPLCDLDGKVIGVNTLINGLSSGLGFAIPSNLAQAISAELIERGRVVRPWLGIRIETLGENPSLQQMFGLQEGVLVRGIEPETPASRSELQPADVIVEMDGRPVKSARELQQMVLRTKVDQTVGLKVWRRGVRGGDWQTVEVVTAEMPAPELAMTNPAPFRAPATGDDGGDILTSLGLEVDQLQPEVARQLGVAAQGVIVTHVAAGSPAAVAGLRRRDVITSVGDQMVPDAEGFRAALAGGMDGDVGVQLSVERGGSKTYAILKP